MRALLVAAAAALVLAGPVGAGSSRAGAGQLVGSVGPGFTIALKDSAGAPVTQLDPGTYALLVHDASDIHDFHLTGSGVDLRTDVEFVGDQTFTVTLADGAYSYFCDPHSSTMRGSFTVGTVTAPPTVKPPAPRRIAARVGPGRVLAFPTTLSAGRYAVTVRDLSTHDNLHLRGPRVERKTGIAFTGTAHWIVALRAGTYRVSSDGHPSLVRRVVVR